MKKPKYSFLLLIFFIFNINFLTASPAEKLSQQILENGMEVFLLEDTSDALVHIEVCVKAGFSSQSRRTNGFFKLYTKLIHSIMPELDSAECNSDFSSYKITVPSTRTEEILFDLSQNIFSLQFSDDLLSANLSEIKKESEENAKSMAGFINSAIDSKVFSMAPWQHDSGIYPELFKTQSQKNARIILNSISQKWYIPKNSALFISGNFNSEKITNQIKNSFGRFYSSIPTPASPVGSPINTKKRFVLHNPEFSQDLTQIVIQYTNLPREKAELSAASLNLSQSLLKQKLLANTSLNIPGDEYIYAGAAHKKDNSRLIIQSLMQKPEEKNSKVSSIRQVLNFIDIVKTSAIQTNEVNFAKNQLYYDFEKITSTPRDFMDSLSKFWAERLFINTDASSLTLKEEFLSQLKIFIPLTAASLQKELDSQEAFVFVIINSDDYKKNRAAYKEAGFEEITIEKASWYSQEMYREIKNQLKPDEDSSFTASRNSSDNDYYQRNTADIKNFSLENGIPLTVKHNSNSRDMAFLISIKGGELNSSQNHGFEEVMINIMAGMIQKSLYELQSTGVILGNVSVRSETDLASSAILITCIPEDFNAVCHAAASALIYEEIPPALADRAVSSRQYKKRLENGSSVRQLYSAAINSIFGKSAMTAITDTTRDILLQTDYKSILQSYPDFLDAGRFSLILTGNFDDQAVSKIEKEFGLFAKKRNAFAVKKVEEKFPQGKSISVKINHTFLTDIPAEKAGPMPAVLIPTTEFLDPVIYVFKSPDAESDECSLFSSLLNYLENSIQQELDKNYDLTKSEKRPSVSIQLPTYNLNAAFIIIQNIRHLKEADTAVKNAVSNLSARLTSTGAKTSIIADIKDLWTKKQLAETASNSGTALLMYKGLSLNPDNPKADLYLTRYNKIQSSGPQDFIDALKYLPLLPSVKVFSKDTKN